MKCLLLATVLAAAEPAPLEPLAFLADSCWVGVFPDKATDEHCFDWVYGGKFLRDRHVVRGGKAPYEGETWYGWDAQKRSIVYWYFNSLGGVSTGTASATAGAIVFPERHASEKGVREFENVWRRTGADGYRTTLREKKGSAWVDVVTMDFRRKPAKPRRCATLKTAPARAPPPISSLRVPGWQRTPARNR